ncbi:MAG: UDP-3-O-(3-hydroxymyristoyl)glucosamine N-acyltransferase [Gemmatimonadetes bacterium]|nr:UDP-3-O-(3-hydroxymyristoyl)glucosamine N-acyltransferase [Gemmatimonadota bacterium]
MTLEQAAALLGARLVGDGTLEFRRVAPIHDAGPEDLAFLGDRRYTSHLTECEARALLISSDLAEAEGGPTARIVVGNAQEALHALLTALYPAETPVGGVSEGAFVHPDSHLSEGVSISPGAVVGAGARLGPRVSVGANSVVGEDARIGADSRLHPNVTLYPDVVLGERVVIHSGTRVGVDGFGYVTREGKHHKIPQVGGCEVSDDVEIGANCTIDRGSIGRTWIGPGCKIDNLVHIAHNVRIGAGSILVAQVGIAGSTEVGPGAVFGGQAGIAGHVKIGAGARIGAQAGVIGDLAPGATVSGYPARNHREYLRAMAALMKLPEVMKRLRRGEDEG